MKIFKSKKSKEIKTKTTLILMVFLMFTIVNIIETDLNSFFYINILFVLLVLGTSLFFYSISLKEIKLKGDYVVIKKHYGRRVIRINNVKSISRIEFCNLNTRVGSKGFFGYNGVLQDGSISLVNDRSKIVKLKSELETYILSVDNPAEFIKYIQIKMEPSE